MRAPALAERSFLLGLALTTGCMLALEVLDTRVLSVVTWYSLGFLVLGMGLFGLTAGAVDVYLRPQPWDEERIGESLAKEGVRFAYCIPLSAVLLLIVPLRVEPQLTTLPLFLLFSLGIALPFYPAGRVVAAALTRTRFPAGRVYAADLLGAALGAPLVPALLAVLDGTSATIALGALAALGAAAFAHAASSRAERRRALWVGAALAACAALNASTSHGLRPLWIKGRPESRENVVAEKWNSHSRVQLLRPIRAPAALWGGGARCPSKTVLQQGLEIDGHAATPLYLVGNDLGQLDFLRCDVTNIAHELRSKGRIAIIGVGGSRDIQAALLAGHQRIVGIELNGRLLDMLQGPLSREIGISERREVELVHDEARSYLTRHAETYDVIQASLIDTWAATGAGAHALSENGLYTVEAFSLFLDRLAPGGILTVSRWANVETARLTALAVATLQARGVAEPRAHVALVAAGPVATLILGREPLSASDLATLAAVIPERGFVPVALPGQPSLVPRLEGFLSAPTRAVLEQRALEPVLDFRPSTDDRPFFFNVVRLGAVFGALPDETRGTIEGNLVATRALLAAILSSLVLVLAAIVAPLSRRLRPATPPPRPQLRAGLVYFGAIGLGFMFAEIALLMKLSLVLGHPSFSLMVVLASLIAAAGLGSLASDRLPLTRRPYCYVYPLVLAAVLVCLNVAWPWLSAPFAQASTSVRVLFSIGVCAVVGVPLGIAFPAGLGLARRHLASQTPWLWGLNGVGSVVASTTAVAIALGAGLSALLWVAAACYLALVPCIRVLSKSETE
ncbi:MAG: hypothetical protein KF718_12755 [Polyangiaceae bacterium]|nr:hypothetical protein [Polyangiaceae bacterium]